MRARRFAVLLLGTATLSGCMTMGGNVKGSFSCVAPEGICAPSSVIDDRALALISGADGDRLIQPAGPYPAAPREGRPFSVAANGATRTGEKVLRIVFPSHIDAEGRLHEQTAVHAVVDAGDWRPAAGGQAVATNSAPVGEAKGGPTLLAALDAAETTMSEPSASDPDMPSTAAIDAARVNRVPRPGRAASADPIGAIKREVAGALTGPPRLTVDRAVTQGSTAPALSATSTIARLSPTVAAPSAGRANAVSIPTTSRPSPRLSPISSAPLARSTQVSPTAATIIPAQATSEGRQAVAAIGANPAIQNATAQIERDARASKPVPMVRAPSFPGIEGAER